jgi:predicted alpha/beta hydrolase family esterase
MSRVLILHGLNGNEPAHWQTWLAEALAAEGHDVAYPDLPACTEPCPDRWGAALDRQLRRLGRAGADERVVVCHSLGCILWLRHCARGLTDAADHVLLVAPPGPGFDELGRFFPFEVTAAQVAAAATRTQLICSDDDPWCPGGAAGRYGAPLALPTQVLPGTGHLNVASGHGPWPEVADLVRGGVTAG